MRGQGGRRGPGGVQPPLQLVGEHQVRQLGLRVGGHPAVAPLGLQVGEIDPAHPVAGAAHGDHPGPGHRQHRLEHRAGEREVAEMIGTELQFEAVGGLAIGRPHQPGVVDEQVKPVVGGQDPVGRGADGLQRGQVKPHDRDGGLRHRRRQPGQRVLGPAGVAAGQHGVRAAPGEHHGHLEPDS